jgi:hypothetical protein
MKFFGAFIASILCSTTALAVDLKFRMQEIDTTLKVGYGVVIADVNGDGKPDIVVCDARRVVWYENPTWKRRIIIEDQTPPDNVCIAPCDIDGDGKIDFFLGADWGRMDMTKGGTIHWLRRGKSLDEKWEVFKIGEEPTVHRMRVLHEFFTGKKSVMVAPLMGRGATKERNWLDGRPVRLLEFNVPQDPTKVPWESIVIDDESFHVVHNFRAGIGRHGLEFDIASYEGISSYSWHRLRREVEGDQSNPTGSRGVSELALGRINANHGNMWATIEPWHGDQVVAHYYTKDLQKPTRVVVDNRLKWGHAIACEDLDGDSDMEIIAGVRDDLSKKAGERRGVRIYKCTDGKGEKWDRQIVDDGGIACEDLVVHDLDGDGRPDIIATGRQTGNVRIYWNRKE